MKKVVVSIIAVIMLLCSFSLVGCGIEATDENSYIVSVYKEMYSQKDNGEVVFEGYKLKESTRVIATQMCELDYEEIEISYEIDGELEIESTIGVGTKVLIKIPKEGER